MRKRTIQSELEVLATEFPVVSIYGPRQSGKTALAKATFPDKPWISLEDLDTRARAVGDPRGFLASFPDGAIFDEIQRTPELAPTTNFRKLNLSGVKGSELLLTVPKENPFISEKGIVDRYLPELTLSVVGSKAKVTCTVRGDLEFMCEFDVSDPNNAVLTSVHFAQTVEA